LHAFTLQRKKDENKARSFDHPPYHSGVVESAGTWLNVGFVYIAGSLRAAGYVVDYYDAMSLWHNWPKIQKRMEAFQPDAVVTTAFTASIVHAIELTILAKKINPQAVTVLGNVHPTFCYEEILETEHAAVDYIVRGEGEVTLPALLDCLNAGGNPAMIAGLAFFRDGGVVATPKALYIQDLDSLPTAWDLVEWPIYSYRAKNNARLVIVSSSRGCQQKCSFCSQQLFWSQTWRARSPENFVDELEMLNKKYGVEVAMLADELPTFDRDRWVKILDLMIERQVPVKLLMETRVDDILRDADIMDKYRQGGVEHIYVGVEAGSQETLDLFRKDTKVEPVIKPKNMSVGELERELGRAAQKFFMHKFQNLNKLTPWKREFMLSVFDILVNNSYLAGQMRAMMKEGKEMPAEVTALIRSVKGEAGSAPRSIAPIP
jgi:anaerobic magnesium-protoporphyrin IX monomethyl ester cyclase